MRIKYPTPEENEAIQRGIDSDPDNPELTSEEIAEMRPFSEVHPTEYAEWVLSRGPQEAPIEGAHLTPPRPRRAAGAPGWRPRLAGPRQRRPAQGRPRGVDHPFTISRTRRPSSRTATRRTHIPRPVPPPHHWRAR